MAVTGRLEDTGVPGILQVFAQSRRTGRLVFTTADAQAVIVLREGQLIYAASNSVRETLGNILVSRGLLDGETLAEALRRQHAAKESTRLGTVLENMGAVSGDQILDVVRTQALRVLREIVDWNVGYFKFEKLDLADEGELPVDLNDFLIEQGLRVDHALLDIAMLEDDEDEAESAETETPPPRVSLRDVVGHVGHPTINAEVTRALLDFADAFLQRSVLMLNESGVLTGVAHSGLPPGTDAAVRDLRLASESTVLEQVLVTQSTYRGPIAGNALGALGELLDLGERQECVLCPLVVNDEVTLLLYGDCGGAPVESSDLLEAVMLQTGLAMEKALLEQKVADLEKKVAELESRGPQSTGPGLSLDSGGLEPSRQQGEIGASSQRIADLLAGRTQG